MVEKGPNWLGWLNRRRGSRSSEGTPAGGSPATRSPDRSSRSMRNGQRAGGADGAPGNWGNGELGRPSVHEDESLRRALEASRNLEAAGRGAGAGKIGDGSRASGYTEEELLEIAMAISRQEAHGRASGGAGAVLSEDEALAQQLHDTLNRPSSPRTLNDEELARKLQEQLDREVHGREASASGRGSGGSEKHGGSRRGSGIGGSGGSGGGNCAGCQQSIGMLDKHLKAMGQRWHPHCFTCRGCGAPISSGGFVAEDDSPWHAHCHREQFHPKCRVCDNFIEQDEAGHVRFKRHNFWGDHTCPVHDRDGTPRCCACDRYQPADNPGADLRDGRHLCLSCTSSVVVDASDCEPVYDELLGFFAEEDPRFNQTLRSERPTVHLVDRPQLHAVMNIEPGRGDTFGLCMSEEHVVQEVYREQGLGSFLNVGTRGIRVVRTHCKVTGILILYGLPRLLMGSVLAHELMHAYLRLSNYPVLAAPVEEGLCQLMSYLYLNKKLREATVTLGQSGGAAPTGAAEDEAVCGGFFVHQLKEDPSEDYGGGFRSALRSYNAYGLSKILAHCRDRGTLPEPPEDSPLVVPAPAYGSSAYTGARAAGGGGGGPQVAEMRGGGGR